MSSYLSLPTPAPSSLPPSLRALQASALRQEPGSGGSTNIRPVRTRRKHDSTTQPNLSPCPIPDDQLHPPNETMLQAFEWYVPADGQHWRRLEGVVASLAQLGVTKMWIPPACKAASQAANGYDIYDLWDLGEFEQKGGRRTKWGPKEELVRMAEVAGRCGIGILWDAVLNHKTGADFSETAVARKVDDKDRTREVEGGKRKIEAWTGFEFSGRAGRYSPMKWTKEHFTGVDWDAARKEKGVWKFEGKEWAKDVDEELGNYDFLLFADIDHKNPKVRKDLLRWVEWLPHQLRLSGMRLDAIKHYSFEFLRDFVTHIDTAVDPSWFLVGEYWREDSEFLARFIEFMNHRISLFDVQLASNFSRISLLGEKGDMRKVLDDALILWKPDNAVTFVVNHDTQAGQSLETPIAPWFLPLAYALILLRANAGIPCVFYSDLFGSIGKQHPQPKSANTGTFVPPVSGGKILPRLMLARRLWAYGAQYDYFDDPHCVGFTRLGHPSKSDGHGLAVIMTNSWEFGTKQMFVGEHHAGEVWTDLLRQCPGQVSIGSNGMGCFPVGPRNVSVWANARAEGRRAADKFVFDHDIYGFSRNKEEEAPSRESDRAGLE
ncbi:hypothetical protein MFIFM68171_08337 [Madurella fahalii]|uniref:Glycosyl hydrolase family 13 catalytic domain-containing protein n=1 Tax=Madurella fahalii TaxID=1157608 RepID=A0ABQ0GK34_9PEZI